MEFGFDFVEFDHNFVSAVLCTPRRLSPRWDAHRGDWLSRVLHTRETTLCSNILAKSKPNSQGTSAYIFIRGPDGCESWKKFRSKVSWHTPFKESCLFCTSVSTDVIFALLSCLFCSTVLFLSPQIIVSALLSCLLSPQLSCFLCCPACPTDLSFWPSCKFHSSVCFCSSSLTLIVYKYIYNLVCPKYCPIYAPTPLSAVLSIPHNLLSCLSNIYCCLVYPT